MTAAALDEWLPRRAGARRQDLELGIEVVGGCCGTTPEHIAAMRQVEKRETSEGKRMRASFSSRYQRILTLPGPVMEGGMQTEFNDETLTIRIPKAGS